MKSLNNQKIICPSFI